MNDLFLQPENKVAFPTDYNSIIERISKINPVQYGQGQKFY